MRQRRRILISNEASVLASGFSNIGRELLLRLSKEEDLEFAELGSYASSRDPRITDLSKGRWKYWGVLPETQKELEEYNKALQDPRNTAQFGSLKFDKVVAEFKPDIVFEIRDFWMGEFINQSPFRKFFKFLWQPTVDSMPQEENWMDGYAKVDLILSYSDFGIHTLKTQNPLLKVFPKPMRPGVDLQTFCPLNKNEVREEFSLSIDIPIIGAVYRNQRRKLTLDLLDAFALMKQKYKGEKSVDKSVLLIHSCWPDNFYSFNYPRHIMRLHTNKWMPYYFKGIKDSILQTFQCHNPECGKMFVSFAMNLYGRPIQNNTIRIPCMYCTQETASPPNVGNGVSREELAKIYNLMDLYVQCTICEGDGMVINEAKACGIPTLVHDYSAMSEKGRFPSEYIHLKDQKNYTVHNGGDVFQPITMIHEPETGCLRAMPDINQLADKMAYYLMNEDARKQKSLEARQCAVENYDWDKLAEQYAFVFRNIKIKDRSETWDTPITIHSKAEIQNPPNDLSNEDFVEWLYINVLKYPKVDPQGAKMWISHLEHGVTRDQLLQHFKKLSDGGVDSENKREQIRAEVANKTGEKIIFEKEPQRYTTEEWI